MSVSILLFDKKNMKKNMFYVIYILGVLIRTYYIVNTNVITRQHDVDMINDSGHLGYIYTLFTTHKLPLTNFAQLYHPPFWHFLASIWLQINKIFSVDFRLSLEGIQILTLLFSSLTIPVVNKICERLKLKDWYRLLTVLFIAIHPTMIILSGSINNDMLMIFLEILIILKLIDWYNDSSTINTVYLAIVTGLCVMTKTNGAIMAIPILYVFIKKLLEKEKIKDYLKKIFIFGIISLPLGLWFQIRSLIKFSNFHMILNAGKFAYLGDYSLFKRFFTLNFYELFNFANVTSDYNLPAYIIKTAIFGEYTFNNIGILRVMLISISFILIIISIVLMIRYLFKKKKNIIINILLVTFITSLISMYVFNYLYPNGCSMDFRYIVINLVPGIIIITYSLNEMKNKIVKITIISLLILFSLLSLIFELMI
jgi:hypothetical protein